MSRQSEEKLEIDLIKQIGVLGYSEVTIVDEKSLEQNLKKQIEVFNNISLSDIEFIQILNHLNKGSVFDRAKILRDKFALRRDDQTVLHIDFISSDSSKNIFQVTHQVAIEGSYKNRYDVTVLINGLPLVQIELKRRGLELKEAFNQINRYQRHSYFAGSGLFQYVQIFVISNGVNTKYYSNNRKQTFKQTFYWADFDNNKITELSEFTDAFLNKEHIIEMITKYIVLHESDKILMVLRPYQYYAVKEIIRKALSCSGNGYIWHTTGSGKTLTSFKASQILTQIPEIDKVLFVVDRKDLDDQTSKEFNAFSAGSIDGTDNTRALVKQLKDTNTPLIVTTIQKLDVAIKKTRYQNDLSEIKDKKVVFIFDECHRSQFGDTHQRIKEYFTNHQMFGFTGTPIFADNHSGGKTTKDLFEEKLHQYVITDAISDENVLKFAIEYVGRYKQKEGSKNNIDIDVEGIDEKEVFDDPKRLEKITDYIINHHDAKTKNKEFTGMMCVSSVDTLRQYYELFKKKKKEGVHDLRVATIFSYGTNEDDKDADGINDDPLNFSNEDSTLNSHSRDALESYIGDYNEMYGTNFTTKDSKSFYQYYKDIAKKVKQQKVDILLVVDMFLTGFDSKTLNTLYVDKNLQYHGLIQAFSRTNRILNEKKSQGQIICFRNLKSKTDQAIELFSNKDAIETVVVAPYEDYVEKFNAELEDFLKFVPEVNTVDSFIDEQDHLKFVQAFRRLLRTLNIMQGYSDFSFKDLGISEQLFEDYKSKYLDLADKVRTYAEVNKDSILNDVDFELELITTDIINVHYIIQLLGGLVGSGRSTAGQEISKQNILKVIEKQVLYRSKRDLIEQFINKHLPLLNDSDAIPSEFMKFWEEERQQAFRELCEHEHMDELKVKSIIEKYNYHGKIPSDTLISDAIIENIDILERDFRIKRASSQIVFYVEKFINGMEEILLK
jgi:type I restriction enzyme R subunit